MGEEHATGRISAADLARHVEAGDVFVLDLRSGGGDEIYGATRYDPARLKDAENPVLPLPKGDGTIVLYDERGSGDRLDEIAAALSRAGYGKLMTLEGGFAAWRESGGRVQEASLVQPIVDERDTSGRI